MKESFNKRGIIVGVFTFIGLLVLAGGILIIGNIHETFSKKIKVVAYFEDVSGLQTGNNIWFSGVKIGTIKNIEFSGKSRVKVVMNVAEDVSAFIPKDAKAKISSDGLIGNKIVVIYGGNSSAGFISKGDSIAVDKVVSTDDLVSTLQESNKNIVDITGDFKSISHKLANGDGSMGKLLNDETVYNNINDATLSLKMASEKAQHLINSLSAFSAKMNKKGSLANDLVTDTLIFSSIKSSVFQLQQISDTASVLVSNLKKAGSDPKSPLGVLLHDEQAGANLKNTLKNLESGSQKLDKDLEALQHSIFLRKYFRKEEKKNKTVPPPR